MTRFLYRCLIGLHPRAFRERFGDEMLCVFDEAAGTSGMFLADGVGSLARQRILRSGLWRWSVGATLTALLIVSYAHSEAKFEKKLMASQQLIEAKRTSPLNQAEFNREAAQAVAMLARFRAADKRKSHPSHSKQSDAPDETAQD